MANIDDYLAWRNDVPFDIDPFNEVDAAVLCELVYADFDGIVPGPGVKEKISISDACNLFFAKYSEEELRKRATFTKLAPFLMQKMIHSKRFGSIKLSGFVNDVDGENQTQFAVCSFYLPDNTIFIAFRGTDDSLIGWKEDFNICFSDGTGGQLRAVDYLNTNFARTMKQLRVGGHSKGGNFAMYGCAYCKPHIKDSIIEIYNFDGPGFISEIIKSEEYKSISKRVNRFIPKECMIGMLMYNKANTTIVNSTNKGINQHDLFSWQIVKNRFIAEEKLAPSAMLIDEIIKKWSVDLDYETRAAFGDIFFASLVSSGASKMSHITSKKIRSIAALTKEIQSLDPENQAIIMEVLTKFIAVSGDSVKNSLLSKLPKKLIMR